MTEIALRTYTQEVKDLIDHGHFDEAIAHCQHILETFPRHIETYRLLGKAFLEQGRHGDAADVFQRVLSAIPEDWLSHVAMAIVREDESNLDMAIWHMERAYEVNPSNTTVQQEVRRLRGRRDGVEPPKLRLTRSALARMYIKGGLFGQAIAEIRSALAEDPERPDLQTLLASALFDSGAVQEATDICSTILQKLPYCMEANRILGLALWASDKKEDAEKLFQRLESLNPYIDIDALKKDKRIQEHPGQSITLTRIEWEQQEKTVRSSKQPTWASSLGLKIEEPQQEHQAIPDWLATASQPAAPATPATPEAEPFGGPTPSWFNDAANAMGTGKPAGLNMIEPQNAPAKPTLEPAVKTGTGELPDWIKTQTNAVEPQQVEKSSSPLPDWLAAPLMPSAPTPEPIAPSTESTLPDWIRTVAPASTTPAEEISGIPDWLSPPASIEGLPPSSLPEWTKPETKTGPLDAEPGNIPDWLSTSKPARVDVGSEPEWLKPPPAGSTSDLIPEWMKGVSPADTSAAAQLSMESVPDWLQENPAPQSKPVEIIPEWMRGESTPSPDSGREKPSTLFAPETDIPEWMKPEPMESPAAIQPPPIQPTESKSADRIAPPEPNQPSKDQAYASEISLPDWMTSPAPPTPVSPAPIALTPAAAPVQSMESAKEAVPDIAIPEWLNAPPSPAPATPAPIPSPPSPTPPPPAQPIENAPETIPEITLPDWLTAISPTAPAISAPLPSNPATTPPLPVRPVEATPKEAPEIILPDWLTAVTPPTPSPAAPTPLTPAPVPPAVQSVEAPAEAIPEIALPDWLKAAAPSAPSTPTPKPAAPISSLVPTPPAPALSAVQPAEGIPEAVPEVDLPDWIKSAIPSALAAPTPVPSVPVAPPTGSKPLNAQVAAQPAPAMPTSAAIEEPKKTAPPPEPTALAPINEGIELPDWLVAQLQGKPVEPVPPPAAAKPAIPLPDWLKPTTQSPASPPVVDWEKAAVQPVPSIPADATRPATGAVPPAEKPVPGATEIPAWLDKSKPSGNETVARWLDRRLKTSTLSSMEDAVSKPGSKPPAQTPPARPAQSSTQLPTWLDSQKPGGSDTVVRWMDKRETGSLRRGPQSAFADAGKGTFPAAEEATTPKPETPHAVAPVKSPVPTSRAEDTVATGKSAEQDVTPVFQTRMEPARPVQPPSEPISSAKPAEPLIQTQHPVASPQPPVNATQEEEEEEGAFVPPPEWLQRALGNAVADVPPNPKELVPVPEPIQQKSSPPTPDAEKPANIRWQTQPAEEPAPVSTAKPAPWVPISPPQTVSETAVKPAKKAAKKKTRKLTDIESEALIREARVYLETDLKKACEVYQQVIGNPASAEVVANDLTSYLEQDPASPQLWNLLGDACGRVGRFQDAYRAYAEALRRM
ncbi:MAG: tetratricopeptide repeat protein [Anaerolineales bacterium]